MKVQIACFSIGLALAAFANSASAADWGDGGGSIKDMSGTPAVAVPAPVPIPIMRASWYFRLDAGVGKINEPTISEEGFEFGEGAADGPFYMESSWFKSDFDTLATFGGGFGYNFGRFRLDATIEKRSKDDIGIDGEKEWIEGPGTVPNRRMVVHEEAKLNGTVWMVNGYYDFFNARGFSPYVGAGIGFAWNHFERYHDSNEYACGTCEVTNYHGTGHADKATLAAAFMAGLSYDVSDITTIDLGYRYLHIAGSDVEIRLNETIPTRLEVGDQDIHQFRAGLRFNVN